MEGHPTMTDGQAQSETETGRANVGNPNLPPAMTDAKLARMQGFTTEASQRSEASHYKHMTVNEAARRLNGDRDAWSVQVVDKTPNDYIDAVHFDHAAFDQYTGVSIEYEPTENGYAVIHPTPTDIFTVERGLLLDVALKLAVHTANAEHDGATLSRREQAEQALTQARETTATSLRRAADVTVPALHRAADMAETALHHAADKTGTTLRRAADLIEP